MSYGDNREGLLVTGDYYAGAFGPTIILFLASPAGAAWLEDEFRQVARTGRSRNIVDDQRIELPQVAALTLERRESGPDVELRRIDGKDSPSFVWTATEDGWLRLAGLMEPLASGQTGHQYLTRERIDDALIEVSLGERHARA
jgi:hypothetical protein